MIDIMTNMAGFLLIALIIWWFWLAPRSSINLAAKATTQASKKALPQGSNKIPKQ